MNHTTIMILIALVMSTGLIAATHLDDPYTSIPAGPRYMASSLKALRGRNDSACFLAPGSAVVKTGQDEFLGSFVTVAAEPVSDIKEPRRRFSCSLGVSGFIGEDVTTWASPQVLSTHPSFREVFSRLDKNP